MKDFFKKYKNYIPLLFLLLVAVILVSSKLGLDINPRTARFLGLLIMLLALVLIVYYVFNSLKGYVKIIKNKEYYRFKYMFLMIALVVLISGLINYFFYREFFVKNLLKSSLRVILLSIIFFGYDFKDLDK